jgi:DNA (cytosine-5)-methyltransferase 1
VATAVNAKGGTGRSDFESETFIAHALRAEGFDASEDGTGRGTPLVPIAFHSRQDPITAEDLSLSLEAKQEQCVAFSCKDHGADAGEIAPTLRSMGHDNSHANGGGQVAVAFQDLIRWAVRRLTPRECERLQGFPDDFTLIPYRNKPATDGPRYKALGNSMAVPVMRWIGKRIEEVDAL